MAERAALITGASSGIGLAIARTLGEEGHALTVSARRPEKLEAAAESLRADGFEVQSVAANMSEEEELVAVFAKHREAYGRLDALVNNAGVGIGAPMEQIQTKYLDMQLAVNLRALIVGTREGLPLLREAGAEHGKALIVNTASIAGKGGQAWLSVYAATKAAVINFTQST
ncbi:MAG TPA: SDR family NAD(P)-dependent oxidoreductase, partial [Solirubrobacterales bacterium]